MVKVEDGKGLKIRTMENKVHLAAWKDAGLNPTPMAWGEVFTALQQNVIDGQENPIAVYYSTKFVGGRSEVRFAHRSRVLAVPLGDEQEALTPCPKRTRICS